MRRIIPLILILLLGACGASRDSILSRTMAGLDAAQKVFIEKDAEYQADIVAKATSLDEGKLALVAYRERRKPVVVAFTAAYSAVAVASLDLTDAAILHVAVLASEVIAALRALGMLPGGP